MTKPDVKVAIAFDSDPTAADDLWTDVTGYVDLGEGITFGRGRKDERSKTTAQTCSLVLDNKDGRFTPDRASSPYYGKVKIGKRIRVTTRVGTGVGNLLAAEDASFEGGTTGAWGTTYFGSPAPVTLANSTAHPSHGTKGLLITWPTAAAGCSPQLFVGEVAKGRTYTVRCVVWIPAGSPAVKFGGLFDGPSVSSTTTGAFETLTFTFTASVAGMYLGLRSLSATTAGQQCYVDSVQVDEAASLGTFTTSPPPQSHRFTGYVTEWSVDFAGGNVAESRLTAVDRIGYVDALRKMRSAPSEAILASGVQAYWPLTDPSGSTAAGQVGPDEQPALEVATYGGGLGTVEFGKGAGPATDGASALTLTPTTTTNGKYLSCLLTNGVGFWGCGELIVFNIDVAAAQTLVRLTDGFGWRVELGIDATGKLTATEYDAWAGTRWTLTSATVVTTGATRVGAVTMDVAGGTVTVKLWLDGVQVATTSYAGTYLPTGTRVSIGGNATGGGLVTGTLSHAALWQLGSIDVATISNVILNGLAGQNVTASVSQVATWAGIPSDEIVTETGLLDATAHRPTEGKSPAEVLQDLATDEGGILYVDGSGRYRFLARSHGWQTSPLFSVDSAYLASRSVEVTYDTQGLANDATVSRPGGGGGRRVINDASVTAHGTLDTSVEVAAANDADLVARAGWEANYRATSYPRVGTLPFDLLTMDEATTLLMQALDVGDTVTVVTWPTQAQANSLDLTVEGWSERLSLTAWTLAANTSKPVAGLLFLADDPVLGLLDSDQITAY